LRGAASVAACVVANAVPVALVLAGLADAGALVVIYLLESAVVGLFWLLWLLRAQGGEESEIGFGLYLLAVYAFVLVMCAVLVVTMFDVPLRVTAAMWLAVAVYSLQHGISFVQLGRPSGADASALDIRALATPLVAAGGTLLVIAAVMIATFFLHWLAAAPFFLVAIKSAIDLYLRVNALGKPAISSGT